MRTHQLSWSTTQGWCATGANDMRVVDDVEAAGHL
jgi:hypothetical protein